MATAQVTFGERSEKCSNSVIGDSLKELPSITPGATLNDVRLYLNVSLSGGPTRAICNLIVRLGSTDIYTSDDYKGRDVSFSVDISLLDYINNNNGTLTYTTGGTSLDIRGYHPSAIYTATWKLTNIRIVATYTEPPAHTHSYTSTVTTQPTCTTTGVRTYTCSCGDRYTEAISAKGHSYGSPTYTWSADGKSCTAKRVCGNDASHTETATATITSAVKTAATCTAKGTTRYTATFGVSWASTQTKDVQDIAALGHSYTSVVTAPTCTAQGYTTHTCSRCGYSYKDTYTAALGHSYTSKVIAPTGSSKGYTRHTCSRCGHYYDDNYTCLITTVSEPSEGGTVTGGGIYSEGASVTLTAIPNENYYIGGWYKDGEAITDDFSFGEAITDPSIEVSADDCATYTVEFCLNEYVVDVNEGENGSITVFTAEGDSFEGENALVFYHGTEIKLTAVPDEGYKFVSFQITENEDAWDNSIGDISDIIGYHYENPFTLTVTGHFKVYAVFEEAVSAPEISDVQMIYSGSQISPTHKVPAGEYFILKAMIL